jgi:hypothetical protein
MNGLTASTIELFFPRDGFSGSLRGGFQTYEILVIFKGDIDGVGLDCKPRSLFYPQERHHVLLLVHPTRKLGIIANQTKENIRRRRIWLAYVAAVSIWLHYMIQSEPFYLDTRAIRTTERRASNALTSDRCTNST